LRIRSSINGPQPVSEEEWNSFVAAQGGHILQSWAWGQLKASFGWQAVRVVLEREGRPVAGAQVLFRPFLGASIAYVPKGPIVDLADREATEELLAALHRLARRRRAIFLKIEPDLADDPALARRLEGYGFRPSPQTIQPRRTILVDLTPDPEAILARMKPKTRYNIRLARRKEVAVREGTEADLDVFYHLMQLTGRRDGFPIHSREYYEAAYRLFVPAGLAKLFLASYRGQVLAGLMAFAWGRRAWYMYGASSDEHRNRMPNHLLQWEAIGWAKEKGCLTYDLWGIPDEDEEVLEKEFLKRSGGLWGVYRFKRGFGGRVVRFLGAYDYIYSPLLYRLYNQAIAWRRARGRAPSG